jgi:hypothetical protein
VRGGSRRKGPASPLALSGSTIVRPRCGEESEWWSQSGVDPELDLALDHPRGLLVGVTVGHGRRPRYPTTRSSLVTGECAAADLFADLLVR